MYGFNKLKSEGINEFRQKYFRKGNKLGLLIRTLLSQIKRNIFKGKQKIRKSPTKIVLKAENIINSNTNERV